MFNCNQESISEREAAKIKYNVAKSFLNIYVLKQIVYSGGARIHLELKAVSKSNNGLKSHQNVKLYNTIWPNDNKNTL